MGGERRGRVGEGKGTGRGGKGGEVASLKFKSGYKPLVCV